MLFNLIIFAFKRLLYLSKYPCCSVLQVISADLSRWIRRCINIARVLPMVWNLAACATINKWLLLETCMQFTLFSVNVPYNSNSKSRQRLSTLVINDFRTHFQLWTLHILKKRECTCFRQCKAPLSNVFLKKSAIYISFSIYYYQYVVTFSASLFGRSFSHNVTKGCANYSREKRIKCQISWDSPFSGLPRTYQTRKMIVGLRTVLESGCEQSLSFGFSPKVICGILKSRGHLEIWLRLVQNDRRRSHNHENTLLYLVSLLERERKICPPQSSWRTLGFFGLSAQPPLLRLKRHLQEEKSGVQNFQIRIRDSWIRIRSCSEALQRKDPKKSCFGCESLLE